MRRPSHPTLLSALRVALLGLGLVLVDVDVHVHAQPSPEVQARISAAIKAAANATGTLDYTAFVNPFIGTGAWLFYVSYVFEPWTHEMLH